MGPELVKNESAESLLGSRSVQAIPGWKRALDLCLLVVLSPVLLLPVVAIGGFIRLVSRGPILFAQQRIGYLGQPFTCWKFRTMHVAAKDDSHQRLTRSLITGGDVPMEKLDLNGDPRVIRFGGLLRASGLDELPQLFNVLLGQMSIVGPRPCVPYEYEQYSAWQKRRFHTLPGLTGLWQVSGKNHTSFTRMIALDIEYVERRSLPLDLAIIVRTIPTIFQQVKELCLRRLSRLSRSTA
jgi:lipopolysaccharide/colanic/teichoic acid biosynthesis glycosyltransferase